MFDGSDDFTYERIPSMVLDCGKLLVRKKAELADGTLKRCLTLLLFLLLGDDHLSDDGHYLVVELILSGFTQQ